MRCACGYLEEYHDGGHCPLCSCGRTPAGHDPYTAPPAVTREAEGGVKVHLVCPGRDTEMRRGMLREPPPTVTRPWYGMTIPVSGDEVRHDEPDRVPRRRAHLESEIAPAALKLGRKAHAAGWVVDAYFRELHDGVQWSIIAFARDTGERAIGVWRKPVGGKWLFRAAAHGPDRVPVGAKRLQELVSDMKS